MVKLPSYLVSMGKSPQRLSHGVLNLVGVILVGLMSTTYLNYQGVPLHYAADWTCMHVYKFDNSKSQDKA